MGGFTQLKLKDTSAENIAKHNKMLAEEKVKFRFYSEEDVKLEYQYFVKGEGVFPEHQFPKNKIKSYKDFTKYWNPRALGEVFCPPFGALQFDCYFNRTSKAEMKRIKNYIVRALLSEDNFLGGKDKPFDFATGSWSTFLERCGANKSDLKLIQERIKEK